MSETQQSEPSLDELRREIDAIDADMHALLIRRGEIIDRLVSTKRSRTGGAFRPDREADMMRRIVERHSGHLPLSTVEHLWREIISTFTQLQAAYTVHLAAGEDPMAMSDMARFYFGFATPVVGAGSARQAVAAVAASTGDLALVGLDAAEEAWWSGLGPQAQVMARLPFIHMDRREAATPALVVSRPLVSVRTYDVMLLAIEGPDGPVSEAAQAEGAEILGRAGKGLEAEHLVAVHASRAPALQSALESSGAACRPAGGYFSPIEARG